MEVELQVNARVNLVAINRNMAEEVEALNTPRPEKDQGGRPLIYNARSRQRRSKEGYTGPHKLVETDMDYVVTRVKHKSLMGSDKVTKYYRYFGKKDSRKETNGDVQEDDDEVLDYYCYPTGGEALLLHDKLLYPKLKDSRIHRWIRLKKVHPYKNDVDHIGIDNANASFEALYEMTHSKGRGSYQCYVETWMAMEIFILAFYPACKWATWLNQFAALEDEVQFTEPVPVNIMNCFLRAHGAKVGEWVTVNGINQVEGRGSVWSTIKNYLSRIVTFQTSLGHRNLSYELHQEPTINNTLTIAKKNINKNNNDLEYRAISYNIVRSIPYICKGNVSKIMRNIRHCEIIFINLSL